MRIVLIPTHTSKKGKKKRDGGRRNMSAISSKSLSTEPSSKTNLISYQMIKLFRKKMNLIRAR